MGGFEIIWRQGRCGIFAGHHTPGHRGRNLRRADAGLRERPLLSAMSDRRQHRGRDRYRPPRARARARRACAVGADGGRLPLHRPRTSGLTACEATLSCIWESTSGCLHRAARLTIAGIQKFSKSVISPRLPGRCARTGDYRAEFQAKLMAACPSGVSLSPRRRGLDRSNLHRSSLSRRSRCCGFCPSKRSEYPARVFPSAISDFGRGPASAPESPSEISPR